MLLRLSAVWRCSVPLAPLWLISASCSKHRFSIGPVCGGTHHDGPLLPCPVVGGFNSDTADPGGARDSFSFARKAMSLPLQFRRAGLLGILRAACGCDTGVLNPFLRPVSAKAFGANSLSLFVPGEELARLSNTPFVCCLPSSTDRTPTVHAGCTQHNPCQWGS